MHPSDVTWQQRFSRAASYLDDSTRVSDFARLVRAFSGEASAKARLVAGQEAAPAASRVGILSGSFNPLTGAHLALADAARAQCGIGLVLWTCAVVTVDKERIARATLTDRLCQLAAYVDDAPGSAVALVNRGLYVDQAYAVRSSLSPRAEITIIVGYDKVVQIFDARYYQDREAALTTLFDAASLLVAPRDDNSRDQLDNLLSRPENRQYGRRVTYLGMSSRFAGDSSTVARGLASSPGQADALHRLIAPEGAALATLGPYDKRPKGRADAYAWRARWQEVLGVATGGAPLPSMSDLVKATTGGETRGSQIRDLLERAKGAPDLGDPTLQKLAVLLGRS